MRPFFLYVLMATIQYSKGNTVIGIIYEVTEAGLRRLDKWGGGYPTVYTHFNIIVITGGGESFDAVTFIKAAQEEEDKPSPEYLAVIQQGYGDWGIA